MSKNKIFIIIVIIAIIAGGVGWYAYNRHQAALAAEKARQEEIAKKNAEAKAYNEAKTAEEKKAAEEQAAKDEMKLDDQGRGPLERELEAQKATPEQQKAIEEANAKLTPEEKARQEEAEKKDAAEYEAIRKMLEAYNKAQNSRNYRTVTGLEGTEYMIPGTDFYKWSTSPERIAVIKKTYQDKKLVKAFDGIVIHALRFTQDNFKYYSDDLYAPRTEAYAEVEVMTHEVEPVPKATESCMAAVWVQKVNGEWKVYHEQELTK